MKRLLSPLLALTLFAGCEAKPEQETPPPLPVTDLPKVYTAVSLADARKDFKTVLVKQDSATAPVPTPPAQLFQTVRYKSPVGEIGAYLSKSPGDGKKHPAILWIFGGFDNDIGDPAWKPQRRNNDQSASAFRKAGIVMMYPSLRGGNDGVGVKECLLGEVDDVLASADFLAKQDFVDPKRIYLGGHSTGGTLALLAAETSPRFRAVFSFGPIDDITHYGPDNLPFYTPNPIEGKLRSPIKWLADIKSPTFVLEGEGGNVGALLALSNAANNPLLHYFIVKGRNHFDILAPVTEIIARKVVADDGPSCKIAFTQEELDAAK
jgi:alpha/beta superfamily hydrolase